MVDKIRIIEMNKPSNQAAKNLHELVLAELYKLKQKEPQITGIYGHGTNGTFANTNCYL